VDNRFEYSFSKLLLLELLELFPAKFEIELITHPIFGDFLHKIKVLFSDKVQFLHNGWYCEYWGIVFIQILLELLLLDGLVVVILQERGIHLDLQLLFIQAKTIYPICNEILTYPQFFNIVYIEKILYVLLGVLGFREIQKLLCTVNFDPLSFKALELPGFWFIFGKFEASQIAHHIEAEFRVKWWIKFRLTETEHSIFDIVEFECIGLDELSLAIGILQILVVESKFDL
jgi:hypothetical protein